LKIWPHGFYFTPRNLKIEQVYWLGHAPCIWGGQGSRPRGSLTPSPKGGPGDRGPGHTGKGPRRDPDRLSCKGIGPGPRPGRDNPGRGPSPDRSPLHPPGGYASRLELRPPLRDRPEIKPSGDGR
jgi:hypothetical protein